ncbi:hypothetical protein DSECCO2_487410 [anaerobic digester metagenome]
MSRIASAMTICRALATKIIHYGCSRIGTGPDTGRKILPIIIGRVHHIVIILIPVFEIHSVELCILSIRNVQLKKQKGGKGKGKYSVLHANFFAKINNIYKNKKRERYFV